MLDIRFIKENLDAVRQNIRDRSMNADVDLVVSLYDRRNGILRELEDARRRRNENAQAMKSPMDAETAASASKKANGSKRTLPASSRNFRKSKPCSPQKWPKFRTWPTPRPLVEKKTKTTSR